jgi:hypothetical protein
MITHEDFLNEIAKLGETESIMQYESSESISESSLQHEEDYTSQHDESTESISAPSLRRSSTPFSIFSETSTIPGIGMVSGRAIKALGQSTINLVENQAIRFRLRKIRSTVDQDGRRFKRMPWTLQADIIEELIELSR